MSHAVRPLLVAALAAAAACATVPSPVELFPPGPAPAGDPLELLFAGRKLRCHVSERVGADYRPVSSEDCALDQSLRLTLPPGSYEVVVEIPCQAKSVAAFTVQGAGAAVRVGLPRPAAVALPRFVTLDAELQPLPGSGSSPLRVKRGDAVTVVRLRENEAGACTDAVLSGPGGELVVSSGDGLSESAPVTPAVIVSSTTGPARGNRSAAGRDRPKRDSELEWMAARRAELRAQARYPEGTAVREPRELCAVYGAEAVARAGRDPSQARALRANRSQLRGQTFYLLTSFRPGGGEILRADAGCGGGNRDNIEVRFKARAGLPSPGLFPADTEWLGLGTLDGTSTEPGPGGEVQLPVLRLIGLVKAGP